MVLVCFKCIIVGDVGEFGQGPNTVTHTVVTLRPHGELLLSAQAERLAYLEGIAEDLQGKGVISNPHTNETIYSVQAVWGVLKSNYDRAENSLRGQILARESGGITPEQYAC